MKRILVISACIALLSTVAAAQAGLPALLAAAIAATVAEARPHAYEVSIENTERGTLRYAFDPAAQGDARIRLLAPAEGELDSRQRQSLTRLRREADGDIWCASAKLRDAQNVRQVSEDAESITYSFTPSAEQAGGPRSAGMVQHLRGEMRVLKASRDVASIRISAPAMFRVSVARIDRFSMSIRCETAANGRRFAASTSTSIAGSALGNRFDEQSVQRITNVRPRG